MVAWLKRWCLSILLGIDQLGHVVLSPILFYRIAHEDETISSRLGRLKLQHGGKIRWTYPLARIIDRFLEWIDPGHSIDAIERDEEVEELISRILQDSEKDG